MRLEKYESEEIPVVAKNNGVLMYLHEGTINRFEGNRVPPIDSAFPVENVDNVKEGIEYIGKELGVDMTKEERGTPPGVQKKTVEEDQDEEKEENSLDSDRPPFLQ